MCVIIHQPPGERLVKKDARALWQQNPHGGGIAYPFGGRIVVRKSLNFEDFWHDYRATVRKHPKVDILMHMRIATHGSVTLDNTHPFQVDDLTVMAHNGIIWDCTPFRWEDRSDTRVFVEDALPNLPYGWQDNLYLSMMVEAWTESKLMFLTVDPNLRQSVYKLGKWEKHKGLHLSNTVGLYPKPVPRRWKVDQGGWSTEWTPTPSEMATPSEQFDVVAPSDDDEYEQWMTELIEEYGG